MEEVLKLFEELNRMGILIREASKRELWPTKELDDQIDLIEKDSTNFLTPLETKIKNVQKYNELITEQITNSIKIDEFSL